MTLWDAVEHSDAHHQEDRMALDIILCALSTEMTRTLDSARQSCNACGGSGSCSSSTMVSI
jgi:hypothetical protein